MLGRFFSCWQRQALSQGMMIPLMKVVSLTNGRHSHNNKQTATTTVTLAARARHWHTHRSRELIGFDPVTSTSRRRLSAGNRPPPHSAAEILPPKAARAPTTHPTKMLLQSAQHTATATHPWQMNIAISCSRRPGRTPLQLTPPGRHQNKLIQFAIM